jgi:hypothetical protein
MPPIAATTRQPSDQGAGPDSSDDKFVEKAGSGVDGEPAAMRLEDIGAGAQIGGLDADGAAQILAAKWIGQDALDVAYRVGQHTRSRMVLRADEATLTALAETASPFALDGDAAVFRLAAEATRIRLAHLFDPYLAVHASRIEALPHQITAVYGEMLSKQPLRFLLADDPGAGKTIMAGLLIKELVLRGDLERCLIVAPGSLVEQWQDELSEKFELEFDILSRDQIETSRTGNPFEERDRLIVRLDMAARSSELVAKLEAARPYDLVICDEAHRMSATVFGGHAAQRQGRGLPALHGPLGFRSLRGPVSRGHP